MENSDYSLKMSPEIKAKLVQLCMDEMPTLAASIDTQIFQDRSRVFAFLVTRGVWYKIRVYKFDWVRISMNSFLKIQLADVMELNASSLKLLSSTDMLMSTEAYKQLIVN